MWEVLAPFLAASLAVTGANAEEVQGMNTYEGIFLKYGGLVDEGASKMKLILLIAGRSTISPSQTFPKTAKSGCDSFEFLVASLT